MRLSESRARISRPRDDALTPPPVRLLLRKRARGKRLKNLRVDAEFYLTTHSDSRCQASSSERHRLNQHREKECWLTRRRRGEGRSPNRSCETPPKSRFWGEFTKPPVPIGADIYLEDSYEYRHADG